VLVPGNAVFYRRLMPKELAQMRAAAPLSNVALLDRQSVVIDRVRFVGCIFWSRCMGVGRADDHRR